MRRRFFYSLTAVALLTGLVLLLVTGSVLPMAARRQVQGMLEAEGRAFAARYPQGGFSAEQVQLLFSPNRLTWIDTDGRVLYDNQSDAALMDNHIDRPEIAQALAEGSASSVRASATLRGEELLYYALRLRDGRVIRLSAPVAQSGQILRVMLPWLIGGLAAALLLSAVIARALSRHMSASIEKIDLDHPEEAQTFAELSPMLSRINQQNQRGAQQLRVLTDKQLEMDALLNAMNEGFIALDSRHRVLTINQSAAQMLGVDGSQALGRTMAELNRQPETIQLMDELDAMGSGMVTLQSGLRSYVLTADKVASTKGAVLLIRDVTERLESETMRKRFTANVSHELRTPLTTICGYSEMLASGMVKKEDQKEFTGRIAAESKRMLALVEDILRLSKLDEGYPGGQYKQVSLLKVVEQALSSLEAPAEKKRVSLKVSGDEGQVMGDKTLLSELVFNLVDNAIKYNREGGKVEVRVKDKPGLVLLTVQDTGMGIEPSQQDKIFERFYRTDKSRSKETGGTGLGLSIVKHSAEYHHASLQVESKLGLGTTVTVSFPKDQG